MDKSIKNIVMGYKSVIHETTKKKPIEIFMCQSSAKSRSALLESQIVINET